MKKTVLDFDVENKKVIIRCDLNVPLKDGAILDDSRIKKSLLTLNYLIKNKAKVIVLSHLGRIKTLEDKKNNSLEVVALRLSELLNIKVKFINETRGRVLEDAVNKMNSGDVILIQNTRFEDLDNKKESQNDVALGKYWASLGDIFINDAFATSHRSHASNVGIASNLNSGIGFLVEKEIKMLGDSLNNPKKPYVVIMGGAKMNDKIKVIDKLIEKTDYLLLGGGIANTFLTAKGYDLGISIYDEESICHAKELLSKYNDKIILPVDGYATDSYNDNLEVRYVNVDSVSKNDMILDIGPKTIELFDKYIKISETIFWNGPVGVSEFKNFEYGTRSLCEKLKESKALVIIGGGDSASSAVRFGYEDAFAHISTGGGASLEFIENNNLPAINIIEEK